jgi:hypothetical protein
VGGNGTVITHLDRRELRPEFHDNASKARIGNEQVAPTSYDVEVDAVVSAGLHDTLNTRYRVGYRKIISRPSDTKRCMRAHRLVAQKAISPYRFDEYLFELVIHSAAF